MPNELVHLGVTATRTEATPVQLRRFFNLLEVEITKQQLCGGVQSIRFHHGDCVGGDEQADMLAYMLGIHRVAHPPTLDIYRAFCKAETILEPAPYIKRNHHIVDADLRVLYAMPETEREVLRSGTWLTIRYAALKSVPTLIILPDGRITRS